MSKGDIVKELKRHGDPNLQVKLLKAVYICNARTKGRHCYKRAWEVISACADYVKKEYKEVNEVAALQAACGVKLDEDAALGMGRRKHVEALPEPSPKRRLCGTPGCALRDGHAGLCEPDKVDGKRMRRCLATAAILPESPTWRHDPRLSIRVGAQYQASIQPFEESKVRAGRRTQLLTNQQVEQWATQERKSQAWHLLARACTYTRKSHNPKLGVEMATRDALQGGDILCVLTGSIVVCHMNPLEPSTPITLPIPFTNLNPLIHSIPLCIRTQTCMPGWMRGSLGWASTPSHLRRRRTCAPTPDLTGGSRPTRRRSLNITMPALVRILIRTPTEYHS